MLGTLGRDPGRSARGRSVHRDQATGGESVWQTSRADAPVSHPPPGPGPSAGRDDVDGQRRRGATPCAGPPEPATAPADLQHARPCPPGRLRWPAWRATRRQRRSCSPASCSSRLRWSPAGSSPLARSPRPGCAPTSPGVDPVGVGWAQSQIRYISFAFLYVVFAVDAVYLFPWALVLRDPDLGVASLVEVGRLRGRHRHRARPRRPAGPPALDAPDPDRPRPATMGAWRHPGRVLTLCSAQTAPPLRARWSMSLRATTQAHPDSPAIDNGREVLTYDELLASAAQVAGALRRTASVVATASASASPRARPTSTWRSSASSWQGRPTCRSTTTTPTSGPGWSSARPTSRRS